MHRRRTHVGATMTASRSGFWQTWFPVLTFWQGRNTFVADLFAGLTVGLVLVPQAMAYAALAGMPPIHGLYAGCFACMAGAMFGRCAQLQTGPVAMTSLLSFAAVQDLAEPGSSDYIALIAILALMVGALRILLGLVKGAAIVALISKPVLSGFGTAAGITIAATQVPKMFAVDPGYANPVFNSAAILGQLGAVHVPTVIMGFATLASMILWKSLAPRLPGLLISLAGAGLASWLLDFQSMGGRIVGDLPAGLPPLRIPVDGWGEAHQLIGGAFMVVIIGLLEVMTVTSTAERRLGRSTDLNGELVGQGAASLVAGATGGFPVSGSLSRSGLNLLAGARTGMSSLVSGTLVLLTLLFLTPLLKPLPYAALGAAIVMAVTTLVRPWDLVIAGRVAASDALCGWTTLVATLVLAPDMVVGMEIGIALSVGLVLWRVMHPRCVVVTPDADGRLSAGEGDRPVADCRQGNRLIVRVDARLSFLNAQSIGTTLRDRLQRCPEGTDLVLYACAINGIDSTACDMLGEVAAFAEARQGRLALADVKAPVRARLERHDPGRHVPLIPQPDSPLGAGDT